MAALHLIADLEELTFGDLRQIVALTKDRADDEEVEFELDDVEDITVPTAIKVALPAGPLVKEGPCHGCE